MEEGSATNNAPCLLRWIARDEVVRTCSYNMLVQGTILKYFPAKSVKLPIISGQYTDCVLSAEGIFVPCHQVVLASCSPYFDVSSHLKTFYKHKIGSFTFPEPASV